MTKSFTKKQNYMAAFGRCVVLPLRRPVGAFDVWGIEEEEEPVDAK